MTDWRTQRILVIGAGRQGTALASYFIKQGAEVTITDLRQKEDLPANAKTLAGLPIRWVLGEHPLSLLDGVDMVCVSGGVPLTIPLLAEARKRGIPWTNDSQLFLEIAPCPVIGITGSAGKTTTTTLVGKMAAIESEDNQTFRKVWVGGNLGNPLLDDVDKMDKQDLAVMELSSFQLEIMTLAPHVAAVLNITPNHLDRHKTMEAYIEAKTNIIRNQRCNDIAVLNRDEPVSWGLQEQARGYIVSFGKNKPEQGYSGSYIRDGRIVIAESGKDSDICGLADIKLRGAHNVMNVLAACAIAYSAGISFESMKKAVSSFRGVAHRLEFVRSWGGADWYNDSIATAPERAMAAMRSFDNPIVLLAGGRDKDLPWDEFAKLAAKRVRMLVLFGEAADIIEKAVSPYMGADRMIHCAKMADAVSEAAKIIEPGDVVLLSPGGTSFDEFRDFEERGIAFRKLVRKLP